MQIILKNSKLKATIDTLGAELIHLEKLDTGLDYMWSGDPTFWSGRSPVLFPIIGKVSNGQLHHEGHSYTIGNHGFARKSEFTCIEDTNHRAVFRLTETEETLSMYPFNFIFDLTYTLSDATIKIDYHITNTNTHVMPFQIGAHPAFNCPMGRSKNLTDWFIEFDQKETLNRVAVKDNLIDVATTFPMMKNTRILPLKPDNFYEYAIVFKEIRSKKVTLKSEATPEYVTLSFENLPDLVFWQPKDAPFLCIEPWYGHGDILGFSGTLMEKKPMIHLDADKAYTATLTIEVG